MSGKASSPMAVITSTVPARSTRAGAGPAAGQVSGGQRQRGLADRHVDQEGQPLAQPREIGLDEQAVTMGARVVATMASPPSIPLTAVSSSGL